MTPLASVGSSEKAPETIDLAVSADLALSLGFSFAPVAYHAQ